MKSQGLPISFIVLIALGVFVLLLVMLFFLSGAQQANSVSQQAAYNSCNTKCSSEIQYFQSIGAGGSSGVILKHTNAPFCSSKYNIAGLGSKSCSDLVSCKVSDNCTPISCAVNDANITCS